MGLFDAMKTAVAGYEKAAETCEMIVGEASEIIANLREFDDRTIGARNEYCTNEGIYYEPACNREILDQAKQVAKATKEVAVNELEEKIETLRDAVVPQEEVWRGSYVMIQGGPYYSAHPRQRQREEFVCQAMGKRTEYECADYMVQFAGYLRERGVDGLLFGEGAERYFNVSRDYFCITNGHEDSQQACQSIDYGDVLIHLASQMEADGKGSPDLR